ncbi:regulatory protein RecX [Ammonicoccus fulvus]|uniref:Regulatory protein RecX n=1 Tax=Ammonicoccus fulvus TaxID=3138240 RepID=A0ABZ3FPJ2_9ACTN
MLRQLTMQARSRSELAEILRKRNVPIEAADAVLDRMTEVGLIDDAAYAQSWVDSRQQRRHLSRSVLRRELQQKGIDRDVVAEAIGQVTVDDEREAAVALAEKKLRSMRGLDAAVKRRRIVGALARKGFGSDLVGSVLRDLDLDADETQAV